MTMIKMRYLMTVVEAAAEQPTMVYHGTVQQFSGFDDTKRGMSTGHPQALLGHFVTGSKAHAATYPAFSKQKTVLSLHLRPGRYFKLPIDQYYQRFPRRTSPETVLAFRDELQSAGYDGIEITSPDGEFPQALLGEVGTFIVFDPKDLTLTENGLAASEPTLGDFRRWSDRHAETVGEWAARHCIAKEGNCYVFYHATPKVGGASTALRVGSYLESDPEAAVHFCGRDRSLKRQKIDLHRLLLTADDFDPGVFARLRREIPISARTLVPHPVRNPAQS